MVAAVNQAGPAQVDGRLARLARIAWPPRCLCCGDRGHGGLDLCAACQAALPWNRRACRRCAAPLAGTDETCGACLRRPPPLQSVRAALVYSAPLDRLLPRFKFHHDLAAGALLARLVGMEMATALAGAERPQALLPVPLHRPRLRQRGYDQALELARPLARGAGLPLLDRGLQRRRDTAPQSTLDARQRRRNLRDAFAVPSGAELPMHVALVDDVMTTGATLHAAAAALRRAGVARVDAWVCARVP